MPLLLSFSQNPLKPAIPPKSLTEFPTDTIIQIFRSMPNFKTATIFSSTSRQFRSIWKRYSATICHAILVQTVACIDCAFDYVKVQPLQDARLKKIRDTGLVTIEATKQICENDATACLALQYYEDQMVQPVSFETSNAVSSTQAQGTWFLQTWYRIHTLASLSSDPLPCEILTCFNLLDFQQMMEVFGWLMYCCPQEHRFEMHVSYRLEDPSWYGGLPKSPISPLHWHNLEACLWSLNQVMFQNLLNDRWSRCGGIHFCNILVHEIYRNITTSKKGVGPAKKAPRIENIDMSDLGLFPEYV